MVYTDQEPQTMVRDTQRTLLVLLTIVDQGHIVQEHLQMELVPSIA
jgi:hypothetical protein